MGLRSVKRWFGWDHYSLCGGAGWMNSLSELTIDQISLKVATHGRQWEQNPQLVRACVGR